MKQLIGKIPQALYGRVAKNAYFWLYLLFSKLFTSETDLPLVTFVSLCIFNLLFFFVPCTLNNTLLVPQLLRKKRYVWFAVAFFANVKFFALIYTFWLKYLLVVYPGIDVFDVSIVATHLTPVLNFSTLHRESDTIFNLLLLLVVAFTGLWFAMDYSRNEKRLRDALNRQLETELNFLRSQINPHFLFNTLNNVYGLALSKSDQVPETVLKLSSVLRYILYESNVPFIAFEKEKETMQAYIDIELLRIPNQANVNFSIISSSRRNLPPLLWLPILENVFKHSAATSGQNDYLIDFRFFMDDTKLTIQSKNSFSANGLKASNNNAGGIGLINLKKRLGILYPDRYTFQVSTEEEKFYLTTLTIHWHEF